MARTELPVTDLIPNDSIAQPSGTTGTVDGHYIDLNARTTINDDTKPEHLLLEVVIATATTDVTIVAGDYPPALASKQGDKTKSLAVGTHKFGPFESGRFTKNPGRLWINYGTPANVTMRAFRFPRNV